MEGLEDYLSITDLVKKAERGQKKSPDEIRKNDGERNCTGFAIGQEGNKLRVLTCAHAIEDSYTNEVHSLTPDVINKFYRFDIHCVHQECNIVQGDSSIPISDRIRMHTEAEVVGIDTQKDLMMLEVDINELYFNTEGEKCKKDHPPIKLAKGNPEQADKVVLAGWPSDLSESMATGQVSSCDRDYVCVRSLNKKGYKCKFLVVHKLICAAGWSGGPVMHSNGLVGVYHGADESMGYAVSLHDVESFLLSVPSSYGADGVGGEEVQAAE